MTSQEKRWFAMAFAVFILSGSLFVSQVVSSRTTTAAADGGIYTEGFVGAPQFVNPLFASSANDTDLDLAALVFSGLLRYNENQELVGDLAESYQVSEDQKQYTFVLRTNITWHDGIPLSVDDVLFTFTTIQDPEWKSPYQTRFKNVTVEALDDRMIRLSIPEPNPLFADYLTIGILPLHLWGGVPAVSATLSELNIKPVGTGPFAYASVKKEKKSGVIKEYILKRNTAFYRGRPHLEEAHIKFFGDIAEISQALTSNSIEGVKPVAVEGTSIAELSKQKNLASQALYLPQYTAAFFNQKNALLKNQAIREALLYSIRKSDLFLEPLLASARNIDGPLVPTNPEFTSDFSSLPFDLKKAEDLLDQAGFVKLASSTGGPGSGIRKKGEQVLQFHLKYLDDALFQKVAEILQLKWKEIGVDIILEPVDKTKFQREVIRPRSFDIVLATEYIGVRSDLYSFWHSSQAQEKGLNLTGIVNRSLDELLEAARKSTNAEERLTKLSQAQKMIAIDEAAALFLYQPAYIYFIASDIKGVTALSVVTLSDRFSNSELWHKKTKRVWK